VQPYFMQPFKPAKFRLPYNRGNKNVQSGNQFHKCPDCGARLWYSHRERIFYCKPNKYSKCYFVAEPEELQQMVQPKIDKWNREQEANDEARRVAWIREQERRERIRQTRELAKRKKLDAVVYYIEFGTRIKIGTTVNIGSRMEALPWDRILLMEPGSYPLEKQRHQQFADQHVTLEWFENGGPLLDHIKSRREELAEFNGLRFKDQGPFPWVQGRVSTAALVAGDVDVIMDPKWVNLPRIVA
jgi:hypothetical protein